MQRTIFSALVLIVLLGLTGCGAAPPETMPGTPIPGENPTTAPTAPSNTTPPPEEPESTTPATPAPETTPTPKTISIERLYADAPWGSATNATNPDIEALVDGSNTFAFDLYQVLKTDGDNQFYSPYSVSQALAMMYAGARGETAQQMAATLHYTLPNADLHPAYHDLISQLANRSHEAAGDGSGEVLLKIANALWGQQGYDFKTDYLNLLVADYNSELTALDLVGQPSVASDAINKWADDATNGKIKKVISPDDFDENIRLVLTSAIYLDADWQYTFDEAATSDKPFYLLDGSEVMVPLMFQNEYFRCVDADNYQAVELPYDGGELSMVILLPRDGWFEAFDTALDAGLVKEIMGRLGKHKVELRMPKFEFDATLDLSSKLSDMGMPRAFSGLDADFTGISEDYETPLYISSVR